MKGKFWSFISAILPVKKRELNWRSELAKSAKEDSEAAAAQNAWGRHPLPGLQPHLWGKAQPAGTDAAQEMCVWWQPHKATDEIKIAFGTAVLPSYHFEGGP